MIGGWAAIIHGSARVTLDVDVVYRRHRDNLERLIQLKRAAGRPKDFEVIGELQALLEERRKLTGS